MKLNINEISEVLKQKIEAIEPLYKLEEIGYVISIADGIATIYGLDNTQSNEVIEFASGTKGLALSLEKHSISVVIIGDDSTVKQGDKVKRTGKMLSTQVGMGMLGRVVDALGNPIDKKGPIISKEFKLIESAAPNIMDRQSISEPLQTGIKLIDTVIPIGKGQRELIIGDRQTGKTTIAIDTIINQKHDHIDSLKAERVFCIYVVIGQKNSSVAQIAKTLEEAGAMEYTIIVSATAADKAILQYLAPYTGCTIGEYFRDKSQHALVIYDDLSKHAIAYRQISLLLKRPPGREAYPGDIFFLHSRLLERAGKLSEAKGGGSLTALPIIETQAGDVSSYVPTNVISITDGQIFLEKELYNKGILPAINVGISVSRVGSAAQIKAMKKMASTIKLELAQFREIESFTKFGTEIDSSTKNTIEYGLKLIELFKQNQYSPISINKQVISIFLATQGYLTNIEITKVQKCESELLEAIQLKAYHILQTIKENKYISDDIENELHLFISDFIKNFSSQE